MVFGECGLRKIKREALESYRLLEFSHLISCEKITEKQHSSPDFKLPATQHPEY